MSLLVALLLLGFGAVLVVALLVWTLLSPPKPGPAGGGHAGGRSAAAEPPRPTSVSNDAVRGARARPAGRRDDDPFERFLHADDERR